MKKKFSKFASSFQYVAGALMIPIIILVVCGLLMGFISPFVNYILTPGTVLHTSALLLTRIASMIMGNLPLWFVIGISFGLAKKNKGYAAFVGVFILMSVNVVINVLSGVNGITPDTLNVEFLMQSKGMLQDQAILFTKLYTSVLGIFTYDTSIFVSIISGVAAGAMMNKWGDIELPNLFSFFAGPKFVMLIAPFASAIIGTIVYYTWPTFYNGIQTLSLFIGEAGLLGTFVYGVVDRALLPFGLHHLITMPLRYTEIGGSMLIDGVMVYGTANIANALAGSATATSYLIRNFTSGRILVNLGGWPGASLAMYLAARPENRKKVLSILIPACFTATFVGITEPIEFTALVASPLLYYLVHVPLSGLAFVLAEATRVSINGFALVFMIPNILQPDKVQAMSLLYLVPLYFALYYGTFRFAIERFDLPTPGRRGKDISLASKSEYQESIGITKVNNSGSSSALADDIITALGGKGNIVSVENCASRLRVQVVNESLVLEVEHWIEELEAMGVVSSGKNFQIIYGPRVINISSNVQDKLNV